MGSIAVLTTSGDNDPEIEPVQSYRHYLYCDGCGSFELGPWETADRAEIERRRRRFGRLAVWATPLVAVPAWEATGIGIDLSLVAYLAIGISLALVLFAWLWGAPERIPGRRRLVRQGIPWFVAFAVTEWLCGFLTCWVLAAAGAVVIGGALVWRAALSSRIESLGLRCRGCGATYGYQTAFFRDLEANPRGLTASDVPRPLGRTPFLKGKTIEPAPEMPPAPLP
jgi:hypothetical protein